MKLFVLAFSVMLVLSSCYKSSQKFYVPPDDNLLYEIFDSYGTVVDYSDIDSVCGLLIETENGEILNPIEFINNDTNFLEGLTANFHFEYITSVRQKCKIGKTVRILDIEEIDTINSSCDDIEILHFDQNLSEFPNDEFSLGQISFSEDSCIQIIVQYSGGCELHKFQLLKYMLECATPPIPAPVFYISHNSNDDSCEAYLTDTLFFNTELVILPDSSNYFFIFETLTNPIQRDTLFL